MLAGEVHAPHDFRLPVERNGRGDVEPGSQHIALVIALQHVRAAEQAAVQSWKPRLLRAVVPLQVHAAVEKQVGVGVVGADLRVRQLGLVGQRQAGYVARKRPWQRVHIGIHQIVRILPGLLAVEGQLKPVVAEGRPELAHDVVVLGVGKSADRIGAGHGARAVRVEHPSLVVEAADNVVVEPVFLALKALHHGPAEPAQHSGQRPAPLHLRVVAWLALTRLLGNLLNNGRF